MSWTALHELGRCFLAAPACRASEGGNTGGTAWHSNTVFHERQRGDPDRWAGAHHARTGQPLYNGFKAEEWGGDFGLRKADVTTIPPVIARGVLIDVAGFKNVEALPSHYEITVEDLEGALRAQGVDLTPGTVAVIRTGTARYWARTAATTRRSASMTPPASA